MSPTRVGPASIVVLALLGPAGCDSSESSPENAGGVAGEGVAGSVSGSSGSGSDGVGGNAGESSGGIAGESSGVSAGESGGGSAGESSGGSAGESGGGSAGESSGGSAGESSGGSAGESGGGSAGESGGGSAGALSASGGAGTSGGSAGEGGANNGVQLPDFEGPTPAQEPIVVPSGPQYVLDGLGSYDVVEVAFDSEQNLVLGIGGAYLPTSSPVNAVMKLDPTFQNVLWFIAGRCYAASPSECQVSEGPIASSGHGLAIGDDSVWFGGHDADLGSTVSKIDLATGADIWTKGWTNATGTNTTYYVAGGPNGSVYGWGNAYGQAPTNPPDNSGGNVLARYESDGTRSFVTQVPPFNNAFTTLGRVLVNADGNAYVGFLDNGDYQTDPSLAFIQVSSTGEIVATRQIPSLYSFQYARLASDERSIYLSQSISEQPQLYNLDLDGSVNWYRNLHIHTEKIEPVEEVTWTGRIWGAGDDIRVTSDSIYLVGTFVNEYANGAFERPTTQPGFVARFDLEGNQIWFEEYQFEDDSRNKLDPAVYSGRLVVGADDNPLAFFSAGTSLYMLKLDKNDGSLVSWQ